MSGQDTLNQLRSAGFSDDEVEQYQTQQMQQLTKAGFSQQEINSHFGIQEPDASGLDTHMKAALDAHTEANPDKPMDFMQALDAGWQSSVTGLAARGKKPDVVPQADAPWYNRLATNTAQMIGDAPAMMAGAIAGGAGGAETGPGAAVTATAGAFAVPTALRMTMMDAYEKGGFKSFGDFWDRFAPIAIETAKSYVTGAATGGAGAVTGKALAAAAPAVKTVGQLGAELTTMTTVGKALDGKVPEPQDFLDAATVLLGAHMAKSGGAKLMDIYRATGVPPAQVAQDARVEPTIAQDLAATNGSGVPSYYHDQLDPNLSPEMQMAAKGGEPVAPAVAADEPPLEPGMLRLYHGGNVGRYDGDAWFSTDRKYAEGYATKDGRQEAEVQYKDVPAEPFNQWADPDGYGNTPINGFHRNLELKGAEAGPRRPLLSQSAEPSAAPIAVPEPGSTEAAQQAILDKISTQGADKSGGLTWDKFYTATVDKLDPLRRAADGMAGENTSAVDNPYKLMRLVAGVQGKAEQFINHGAFDFKTLENTGPSLKEIVSPFKDDLDGFRAYMASRRAVELEGRGIESGMPADAARQVVAAGGAKYEDAFQKLQDYQDSTTRYLRDAGVLSDDGYAAMKDANKAYVPFNRVMDDSQGFGVGNRVRNPIKTIKGSERDIIDPLETIVRNTYSYMNIAERNNVARTFFDQASKTEDPSQYFEAVPPSLRATTVTDPEMAKFLKSNGIDAMPDSALTVFRAMRTPLGKDEVGFFDNGQYKVMKVDPDVAEAFNGTPPEQHGLLFKMLQAPAKLFRAGLVVPEFIVRHLVRNQMSASALAEHGNIPFWDTFKGLVSVLGKDQDYQNWLKSGGAMISAVSMDRDNVQAKVREIAGQDPAANFLDKAWNIAKTPMDVLHAIQSTLENGTRVGAFKRALGDNETKQGILDAGFSSRNIAPDPARIGEATRNWNAVTALFNVEIQHSDQLISALRDRPLGTMAKIFAGITIPSALLWMNNHDKDEWREAHQWERDAFWLVPMNGVMLRIPKPFLLGTLFGSSVERMLDGIYGNDGGRGAKEFAHSVLEQGVPHLIPNAITPALEQLTNYSFFRGGPLVPDRVQKLMPEYRYTEYTSELEKALGHVVGMVPYAKDTSIASPLVIDNYVRQWTGGMGVYALQKADEGLRKAGVLPDPVKPTDTLADMDIIKAFVVRYPSATADSIQHFHDQYTQRKMVYDTFTELAKRGDGDAAMEVMKANPTAMMKLDGIERTLSQQNNLVRMIYRNPDIQGDQKRQLIDATYYQMIQISHMGNELIKQVDATAPNLAGPSAAH